MSCTILQRSCNKGKRLSRTDLHAGGDAFFTICLWRSGFALTDPGFSVFTPDAKLFDPFQYEVQILTVPIPSLNV